MTSFNYRRATAVALALAAVGIELQILGGADYPTVPPGLLILLAAAAVMFLTRKVWAIGIAAFATLFISIGGVVAPNLREQLTDSTSSLVFVGSLVQIVGLVAALALFSPALRAAVKRRSAPQGGRA